MPYKSKGRYDCPKCWNDIYIDESQCPACGADNPYYDKASIYDSDEDAIDRDSTSG